MRIAPGDDIARSVGAATGEGVTLVLEDGESLAHAQILAAIAPLAIAHAPMRVNAVAAAPGADAGDVAAAVAFLASARSTTGQILRVDQPRVRPHDPSCSSTKA